MYIGTLGLILIIGLFVWYQIRINSLSKQKDSSPVENGEADTDEPVLTWEEKDGCVWYFYPHSMKLEFFRCEDETVWNGTHLLFRSDQGEWSSALDFDSVEHHGKEPTVRVLNGEILDSQYINMFDESVKRRRIDNVKFEHKLETFYLNNRNTQRKN